MINFKNKTLKWFGAVLLAALAVGFVAPAVSNAAVLENAKAPSEETSQVAPHGTPSGTLNVTVAAVSDDEQVNDPLEPINRVIFDFNEIVQDAFLRPVTKFYNQTVPPTFREGLSNFLDNLSTPVVLANDILQGEFERALQTFGRFFVNSTVGILGFADVAAELGVERHEEDFGQTLGSYGVGEGFYLVLPIFGPSNPRDVVGKFLVDGYFDPLNLYLENIDEDDLVIVRGVIEGLDEYAGIVDELDQVKKTSVDYYAAVRSLYRQKRKTEINNGSILELPPIPDLGYNMIPEDFDQPLAGVEPAQ
ncbi:MAG: VacJ family lipoprotein [Proteobacteria bacterium]|nr:VacJ family lipoprotein [Pseudomonadota bacterium]MDA1024128.1 VacJ family lipoprotein [Pseudomonadota bacterium]